MKSKILLTLALLFAAAHALYAAAPAISVFSPASGPVGTLVKINGTNLSGITTISIGGTPAIVVSNTSTQVMAMVMPGAVTGGILLATAGGNTAGGSSFTVTTTVYPNTQSAKVSGNSGTTTLGSSLALSANGTTAVLGAQYDNVNTGAACIFTFSGGAWTQQGPKLVGTGYIGRAYQGSSVAISADGNTVIVGGLFNSGGIGAAWVYTRSGTVWTQQGNALSANDNIGTSQQGSSVALSANGNIALVGGQADNGGAGAVWVYTRSLGVWSQSGNKLVGAGATGAAAQGRSAAISADGTTAAIGGLYDNGNQGAVWVFTNSGGTWTQQGNKLSGTGGVGIGLQGGSVALSADGNTLAEGGFSDNSNIGAVWVFTRSGGAWSQQGGKLAGTGVTGTSSYQGLSIGLSADGNTIVEAGTGDNHSLGAAWAFTRSGGTWMQQGSKLVNAGFIGPENAANSVAISADSKTTFIGGIGDNHDAGAAFAYKYVFTPQPMITNVIQSSGPIGTLVTIIGTNLGNPTSFTIAGASAIVVSNTGTRLVGMVMPGATNGNITVVTAGGTASGGAFMVTQTPHPGAQQGAKLVGTGNTGPALQGASVSVSADGNTAIVGGNADNSGHGSAWVFARAGTAWSQQAKLFGTGSTGTAAEGYSVAINADGNTAVVGGHFDNSNQGAIWIFTRTGTTWTQQGAKLPGPGNIGPAKLGGSVAISADGNTVVAGGFDDNSGVGAAWVYARIAGVWSPGLKLVGTGNVGVANEGSAVAISQDGNTIAMGGSIDNNLQGAVWIFTRSGGGWVQQGQKLAVTDNTAGGATIGGSVALSADGNTLMTGGLRDDALDGAAWVFTRSGGSWVEQAKLLGTDNTGYARQGCSVAVSADGNTATVGGYFDNLGQGAIWVYTRSGLLWTQQYGKLVGTGSVGAGEQGVSIALSATGATCLEGGNFDNTHQGAAWVFVPGNPVPSITSFGPMMGPVGTLVTINGSNLDNPTGFSIGGKPALVISNAGTQLVGMVMPGSVTGSISVTTAFGTATALGNFTVTPTLYPSKQQGNNIAGTGSTGAPQQGSSVAISADGNTAVLGGLADNSHHGAAWIFTRTAGNWLQQGTKLLATGNIGLAYLGRSAAISADGNTALLGGYFDNNDVGAAWVFVRNGTTWTQQAKLVGAASIDHSEEGFSVSLSADGNVAVIGGPGDNGNTGAAWVFKRSGRTWVQQGQKLVGSGASGGANQGKAVSVSADGNTIALGGDYDGNGIGAAWIFINNMGNWVQQGAKLVGTGAGTGSPQQGSSVALSADGKSLVIGGPGDNDNQGACWIFTRSGSTMVQQGSKLVAAGNTGAAKQGGSVGLSADGNTLMAGGLADNSGHGASWIFTRNGTAWAQQGNKIVGAGSIGTLIDQGVSVAVSADGTTGFVGGDQDNSARGSAWAYIIDTRQAQIITFGALNPATYGDADVALGATSSSALQVAYASSNSNVATIVNGKIHITGAGNAFITASQAGNATYKDATPVNQLLTVNKAALTVTADDNTRQYGQPNPAFTVHYTGFVNGDNVGNLTTPAHATCNAFPTTTVGMYAIKPAGAVSSNYSFTYMNGTLTITKADQSISFEPIPPQNAGTTYNLAVITATSGQQVAFTSSNHTVATITGTTFNSLHAGSTVLTASQAGTVNYNPAVSVMQTVTVVAPVAQPSGDLFVHQSLSPNGDGVNDVLVIDGLRSYPDNNLKIMDRSGQVIFETNGYNNSTRVFDGHSSKTGKKQQSGTYFYTLEYRAGNELKHRTGFVVLKY